MKPEYPKLIFAVLLTLYFLWIAYDPMQGSFLDLVDLPIHETGHLVFRPFGEFMSIAGGSLFQVILPAVFVGYFIWQRKYYSAAIVLFWVGQSILNVCVYAADAVVMQLVLTSGFTGTEGSFHDWNYLADGNRSDRIDQDGCRHYSGRRQPGYYRRCSGLDLLLTLAECR